MAELDTGLPVGEQLSLIAQLRWNLFRNSLRTFKGRLEFISFALVSVTIGLGALGAGFGLGIAAYFAVAGGHFEIIPLLLWGVFLVWQLFPLFAAAASAQFDFANLLRFPLRYSSFYLLTLAYGVFDPPALVGLLWCFCIGLGVCIAKPALFLWAPPVLVIFAAVNLLLNRAILAWLDRWLKQRRTREAFVFVFLLVMISLQFLGPLTQRWESNSKRRPFNAPSALEVARAFPPGLAGLAISRAAQADPPAAAASAALLVAYAAVIAWALGKRLRAQYQGELISETRAPEVVPVVGSAAGAVRPAWQLPGLSPPVAAVFEKEVRYLFRSGPALLQLIVPLIILAFFGYSMHSVGARGNPFTHVPVDMFFPVAVAYAFLIQTNMVYNSFGFDGSGVQFLFMAPVRFRDVLIGKNFLHALVTLLEAALVGVGMAVLFRPPGAAIVLATLTGLLFASLGNFAVGDLLSLAFPRRMEYGMIRQRRVSGVTVAASLGIQAVLLGICGSIIAFTFFFHRLWLATVIFLVLTAAVWPGYVAALNYCSQLALDRREVLTAELSRQE
jgi:ABC-2 type transport system permease protein